MEISDIQESKDRVEITFADESNAEDCVTINIKMHDLEQLHDYFVYLKEEERKQNERLSPSFGRIIH